MTTIETRHIVMIPGLCSDAAIWRRTIAALGSDFRCNVGDTLQDSTLPAMARRILDGATCSHDGNGAKRQSEYR